MLDFSKHVLKESHLKDELTGHTLDVWELKVEGTMWDRVIFINSCGILTVDGDYGRWSFCRQFIPSAGAKVSVGYWCEKLRTDSTQSASVWDGDVVRASLNEWVKSEILPNNLDEEVITFFEELADVTDDQVTYEYMLYRECPLDIDYEYLPSTKTLNPQLKVVFAAFDEICSRLK